MKSWTVEDLKAAINCKALTIQTDTLEEIYYYAGGCIRAIQWSVGKVKERIIEKLSYLSSISPIVRASRMYDITCIAENELMAFYDESSVVISKFAFMRLIFAATDEFVRKAKKASPDIPAWQNMIAALEVLRLAVFQLNVIFRTTNNNTLLECWGISPQDGKYQSFENVHDTKLTDLSARWLVPSSWLDADFNAIFRVSEHHIRFVYISTELEHPVESRKLIPFISAMNAHTVEIVFVCQRQNFDRFSLPKIVNIPPMEFIVRKVCYQKIHSDQPFKYDEYYFDIVDLL